MHRLMKKSCILGHPNVQYIQPDQINMIVLCWNIVIRGVTLLQPDYFTPLWIKENRIIKQLVSVGIDKDCIHRFKIFSLFKRFLSQTMEIRSFYTGSVYSDDTLGFIFCTHGFLWDQNCWFYRYFSFTNESVFCTRCFFSRSKKIKSLLRPLNTVRVRQNCVF